MTHLYVVWWFDLPAPTPMYFLGQYVPSEEFKGLMNEIKEGLSGSMEEKTRALLDAMSAKGFTQVRPTTHTVYPFMG